jgi:hypothetical protein
VLSASDKRRKQRVKFDGEIMEIVGVGLDLSLTGTGVGRKGGNVLNVETQTKGGIVGVWHVEWVEGFS